MTKRKFILLCMLVGLLLFLPLAICSAEQTYQVTEQELTQLENNLSKISKQRSQLLKELTALNESQVKLEKQLSELKALSLTQEMQLKTANESLQQYAKEVKNKERRIKRQRTFAYLLCGGLAYALAIK